MDQSHFGRKASTPLLTSARPLGLRRPSKGRGVPWGLWVTGASALSAAAVIAVIQAGQRTTSDAPPAAQPAAPTAQTRQMPAPAAPAGAGTDAAKTTPARQEARLSDAGASGAGPSVAPQTAERPSASAFTPAAPVVPPRPGAGEPPASFSLPPDPRSAAAPSPGPSSGAPPTIPPGDDPATTTALPEDRRKPPQAGAGDDQAFRTAMAATAATPTNCLPAGLKSVLSDVAARFGKVTLISTTQLHTDNHSAGSVRHNLHRACKAVDFKVQGDRQKVLAYLRTRREVNGINAYGNNGVIHIDASEGAAVARAKPRRRAPATSEDTAEQ